MTEVRRGTDQQGTQKSSIDFSNLSANDLQALEEYLTAQRRSLEGNEGSEADSTMTPSDSESGTPVAQSTEDNLDSRTVVNSPGLDNRRTDPTDTAAPQSAEKPRISRRTLLWGAVVGAGVVGGGITAAVLANQPRQTPTSPASADRTPTPSASDTPRPSPTETGTDPETTPAKSADMVMAETDLNGKNSRFNTLELTDRQRAIDWMLIRLVTEAPQSGPLISGTRYNGKPVRTFAPDVWQRKDLLDYSPVAIAINPDSKERDNREVSAPEILNQLAFAEAAAWGQLQDPPSPALDQNRAANMVSGLFYDPNSAAARDMREQLQRSRDIKLFGPESYAHNNDINGEPSDLLNHTFDKYGNLDYRVINYNIGKGDQYVIVTPVETEFTGIDPEGSGKIVTTKITKWLILKRGPGTENTLGRLTHLS